MSQAIISFVVWAFLMLKNAKESGDELQQLRASRHILPFFLRFHVPSFSLHFNFSSEVWSEQSSQRFCLHWDGKYQNYLCCVSVNGTFSSSSHFWWYHKNASVLSECPFVCLSIDWSELHRMVVDISLHNCRMLNFPISGHERLKWKLKTLTDEGNLRFSATFQLNISNNKCLSYCLGIFILHEINNFFKKSYFLNVYTADCKKGIWSNKLQTMVAICHFYKEDWNLEWKRGISSNLDKIMTL